jgi:nucleoside phosphorylase
MFAAQVIVNVGAAGGVRMGYAPAEYGPEA